MSIPVIRKASRKKARLRLGIAAPSGAGKTMGALLLAYGIAKDWNKIGVVDTEEGSAELYVGVEKHGVTIGDFNYIRISKDFAPVHYTDAIKAFEQSGVEIIIIDSLTHAWAGAGGLLDKQGKIADASKSGNSYVAWRTITPEHTALVNSMLQSPCHIIGTMRSKVEYAQGTDPTGKPRITKLGLAPIQREGMEYEFTTFFDIDANSIARTTKDRTDLFASLNAQGTVERKEFIITPATGEKLLEWLNRGEEPINYLVEIQKLLSVATLDDSKQGLFVAANKEKIADFDEETQIKIYEYLKTLTQLTN